MKLLGYEWKKLWKSASVLKLFLFFIILSGTVFWGELNQNKEWISEYLNIHRMIEEKVDASAWFDKINDDQSMLSYEQIKALEQIRREYGALNSYDIYRESIKNQYEKNQAISIFSDSQWNQGDYMKQIAETYEKLQITAPMKFQPYLGVEYLLDYYAGDLLTVVFLIYLVSVVFLQEEKTGRMDLALTMFHGKIRFFLAKVFVVFISLAVYIIFVFLLNLMLATVLIGPLSFSVAIQSIPEYFAVPYAWTIGQYIFISVALKIFAAAILVATAVVFARRLGSGILTAVGMTGILGFSIWTGSFFQGDGLNAVVRFWNVWSFLRGKPIIGTYELIRFGNSTIEVVWGIIPSVVLIFVLIFWAGNGKRKDSRREIKIRKGKKQEPHAIFYYEMKKMWIYQKGFVFFAACILLQGMAVWQYRDYFGTEEYYYQQYIDRFGNRITNQTDENIKKEENYFEKIEEKLSQEEDVYRAETLQKQLECRIGFEKYVNRIERLKSDAKENILLKDIQYSILFGFTEVSRMMVILLCISLAFLIPAVFQKEKETQVEILQKTAVYGGAKLWNAKIASLLLYTIPLIVMFQMFSFCKAVTEYDLQLLAPVDCLLGYWNSGIKLPIVVFFFIGILIQCISISAVIIILSTFGKRVRNQYMLTGMILGGTVVPTLLSPYLSAKWLRSIHDLIFVFTYQRYWMVIGLVLILITAIVISGKERKWRE